MNFYLQQRNFKHVLNNSFKQYFLEEFETVKKELNDDKTGKLNKFYLPEFVVYLNDYFMGISALWSNTSN